MWLSMDKRGHNWTIDIKKASFYAGFPVFSGFSWTALENEMVEAAGIEPASGNGPRQITTCLAFIQF